MNVTIDSIIQYIIGVGIIGALINRFGEIFYNARKAKESADRAHVRITESLERIRSLELDMARANGKKDKGNS